MADIELVIKISEGEYNRIQSMDWKNGDRFYDESVRAIHYGKPLPIGHGRLIDAELLDMKRIDYIVDGYANDADDCAEFGRMIILAPTLVEADGGEE